MPSRNRAHPPRPPRPPRRPRRPPRRRVAGALPLRRTLLLGALHGPAELLPISSSGHVTVVPWLLGWRYAELDEELRKSFEVALHAGTAAALMIALRGEAIDAARRLDPRGMALIALTLAPPAAAGLSLERQIERRLGTPRTVAAGLLAGAVAMALADRRPQTRRREDATAGDALWLGIAQACALLPGVSRNGATLATARFRRFTRPDASLLSRHAALPAIAGAAALKGYRLYRRGVERDARRTLAAGAAASFASTLVSTRLIRSLERDGSLLLYVVYRSGLAGMILARLRC
jgi:undecaprenyl-diphosphatase